jgi:hypothetical protein
MAPKEPKKPQGLKDPQELKEPRELMGLWPWPLRTVKWLGRRMTFERYTDVIQTNTF